MSSHFYVAAGVGGMDLMLSPASEINPSMKDSLMTSSISFGYRYNKDYLFEATLTSSGDHSYRSGNINSSFSVGGIQFDAFKGFSLNKKVELLYGVGVGAFMTSLEDNGNANYQTESSYNTVGATFGVNYNVNYNLAIRPYVSYNYLLNHKSDNKGNVTVPSNIADSFYTYGLKAVYNIL